MKDIVEAALKESTTPCPDDESCSVSSDEFLPPSCAVVGCGATGANWLRHVDAAHVDIALGCAPTAEAMDDLPCTQIQMPKSGPKGRPPRIEPSELDQALEVPLDQSDIVAVVLELNEPRLARQAASVCRSFADDQTVFAVPAIPADGLSGAATETFYDLVDAAGTTIPYDLSRIREAFGDAFPDGYQQEVLDTTGRLIIEWVEDIFEALRGPLSVPLDRGDALTLLRDGGVSLLYWGWGCREDSPDVLLQQAGAHRVCDGDRASADGGLGLLRFGGSLTVEEFEAVQEHAEDMYRPDGVPSTRWLTAGQSSSGLGDDCRLALLVTGVDMKSLPFVDNACTK